MDYQLGLSDVSDGDFCLLKYKITTVFRSRSVCVPGEDVRREMRQWETVPLEACLSPE